MATRIPQLGCRHLSDSPSP
nr:hypothetical protein [Tanacetum cinerariifolium]